MAGTALIDSPAAPKIEAALPWRKDSVAASLRRIRRRERLFNILALALTVLAGATLYAVVEMACDRAWEFAPATRQIALTSLAWFAAAAVPSIAILILFRRLNPLYYARAVD